MIVIKIKTPKDYWIELKERVYTFRRKEIKEIINYQRSLFGTESEQKIIDSLEGTDMKKEDIINLLEIIYKEMDIF